jgi:hypothetical protein
MTVGGGSELCGVWGRNPGTDAELKVTKVLSSCFCFVDPLFTSDHSVGDVAS